MAVIHRGCLVALSVTAPRGLEFSFSALGLQVSVFKA